jgi:hypothetical protein
VDRYYKICTVKYNSCVFYYCVKMSSQEQHVSTQLTGHHQGGIVMKLKMAVHKQYCHFQFHYYTSLMSGPGSSVGIATDYGLDGPGIENRWRCFAHVQTGHGVHPAPCTLGTGSFQGVKRPGRGADYPPLLVSKLRLSRAIPLLPV